MKNKIHICENKKYNFSDLQRIIINSLSKEDINYSKGNTNRTLIFINDNVPSLLINIRATLWYYKGYSYPHLVSDDNLVDEAFIVITTQMDYLIHNVSKFRKVVSIYNSLSFENIMFINKSSDLLIIEDEILKIEQDLVREKILFRYIKIDKDLKDNIKNSEFDDINCNPIDPVNFVDILPNKDKDIDCEFEYKKDKKNNKYNDKSSLDLYNNIFKGMNFKENRDSDNTNDRALFIIKPRTIKTRMEFILLNRLLENGFLVLKYTKKKLPREFWEQFYNPIRNADFFNEYCSYLTSDFVGIAIIYSKYDVFSKIRNLIGPTDPKDCKPFHLRFQFGYDLNDNGMHASDSLESFKHEMEVLKNFKVIL